jgi:hypothetical protein
MGDKRGVFRILLGKPEGKRPLGRPRRSWEDNIKMDLQEVGCGGMDWIDLAQDMDSWRALVNVARKLRVLSCRLLDINDSSRESTCPADEWRQVANYICQMA